MRRRINRNGTKEVLLAAAIIVMTVILSLLQQTGATH